MRTIPLLLANADTGEVSVSMRLMDPSTRGMLIILGALGLVILLVLLWAVFLRKSGRRRRSHHHSHEHSTSPTEGPDAPNADVEVSPPQDSSKPHRSRRKRRSRNPTLAETGGLPPIRPESPPESRP